MVIPFVEALSCGGGSKFGWKRLGGLALGAVLCAAPASVADSLSPDQPQVPLGGTLGLSFSFDAANVGRDAILFRGSSLGPLQMDGVPVPLGGRVREVSRFEVTSTSMTLQLPVPDNPLLNGRAFCLACVVEADGQSVESSNAVSVIIQSDEVLSSVVPHPEVMGFEALESASTATFRAASFPSASTGYLAGSSALLLKTQDGGATFTEVDVTSGAPISLNDVEFLDPNVGFVAGHSFTGVVYRTSDGGQSWRSSIVPGKVNACDFVNASTGYVVGQPYTVGTGGPISRTNDGGLTWTSQADDLNVELMDVRFVDADTGYAVGRFGTIVRTDNGGATWAELAVPLAYQDIWFMGVEALDASTAIFVGSDGVALGTVDGGQNFHRLRTRTRETLRSVQYISSDVGFITGDRGTLLHTYDGGATWVPFDSFYGGHPNTNLVLGIDVVSPERAIVVGYNGMVGSYGPAAGE